MHTVPAGDSARALVPVTVQGVEVFVRERGAGEPVLFLHGNPDSADVWDPVIASSKKRFRCIAIDLPGFGRSAAPDDFDCSFGNLGRFVDEVVGALGIDRPLNVVAHDFGGAFAMAWAALFPDKVRRQVVINHPFFVGDYRWHAWARIWRTPALGELSTLFMGWWPLYWASVRAGSRKLSTARIRQSHGHLNPAMKRMILRLYRAADPAAFREWELRMLAAARQIPTLVLWGEHDPYIPAWVAGRFGTDRVRRYEDSGHWLPAELPEEVAAALRDFLGSAP